MAVDGVLGKPAEHRRRSGNTALELRGDVGAERRCGSFMCLQ